jgi:hypothetical protein
MPASSMQHIHLGVATLIKAPRKMSGPYDPAKYAPQTSALCSRLGSRVRQCYRWRAAQRVGLCWLLLARHRSEPVYALIDGSERSSRCGNYLRQQAKLMTHIDRGLKTSWKSDPT